MGGQEDKVAKIIQDEGGKKILFDDILKKYKNSHGTKLVYSGGFKSYIETIPGVTVNKNYATWIGKKKKDDKKKVDNFDCKLCGVKCTSKDILRNHEAGKKHQKKLADINSKKKGNAAENNSISLESAKKLQLEIIDMINDHGQPIELTDLKSMYEAKYSKDLPHTGQVLHEMAGLHIETTGQGVSKKYWVAVSEKSPGVKQSGNKKVNEVKIAVHDSSADIITFKESIGGKSAKKGAEDATQLKEEFESMSLTEKAATVDELASSLFQPKILSNELKKNKGLSLYSSASIGKHAEGALFGHLFPSESSETKSTGEAVYLNTHEPFCFVTVGVQGAGKSHTSSCVLESCLVPFEPGNIVKLNAPMISMVLHYDQNTSSICEAAGLLSPNPAIKAKMAHLGHDVGAVAKEKAVILVSSAFYRQRKKFYGDYCTVKPLLFRWRSLTADHIKRIMRIESGDNQLYVASFLDLLRSYQKQALVPDFSDFLNQVRNVCSVGSQKGPLDQRIALLESVVAESEKNAAIVEESLDLITCSKEGYQFIITDLTDPLLSKEEANGLFQVLTEQFRTLPTKGGKVLCLDECHKYMNGEKADGLSESIVNAARLMRHDGVRLVASTQSPKALAPELLELVTVAALHHFHSPDWWAYLKSKLPLHEDAFERILSLGCGEAVAFATSHDLSVENVEGSHCLPIRIRPRITEDLGSSRRNS